MLTFTLPKDNEVLKTDIDTWIARKEFSGSLFYKRGMLSAIPEFNSVLLYRLYDNRNYIRYYFLKFLLKREKSLFICTPNIGAGLYIMHGFSTIISAKTIGRNCTIYQQVTLGHTNADESVSIGDNVTVYAGVIAIGSILIGDNAEVGAGAVVVKDVPSNSVVVGNPARVIRVKKI